MRITSDIPEKTDEVIPQTQLVSDLWFEDGGLIIQAEQSFFKIYKGILAARSSVFKAMLDEDSGLTKNCIDGCDLLQVPDSAADMTYLLRAIFDSG